MPAAKGKTNKKAVQVSTKFFSTKLLILLAILAVLGVIVVKYSFASSDRVFVWNSRGVQHEIGSHTIFADGRGVTHQVWSVTPADLGPAATPAMWHGPLLRVASPGEPGPRHARHDYLDIALTTNTAQSSAYEAEVATVSVTGIAPNGVSQSLGSGKLSGWGGSNAVSLAAQHVLVILPDKGTYTNVDVSVTPHLPATVSRLSIESETIHTSL